MNYHDFFTNRPTAAITADLIGRMLTYTTPNGETLGGRIVEAEAYLGIKDRAAHSYNSHHSPANEGLYKTGGTIYIYAQRQYFFFDVAAQAQDIPEGILIRAIEPTLGQETMVQNRGGKTGTLLTNGPAKMMQAFGIHDKNWDLHKLEDSPFVIDLNGNTKLPAKKIIAGPRIGINQSDLDWAQKPLRYYVQGNPYVSGMKKHNYAANNGWQQ